MTQLVEMRFIKKDGGKNIGDQITVPRGQAAIMEARAVAVRVRPPHAKQKPITSRHAVTKGD